MDNTTITIDKGIPLPPRKSSASMPELRQMNVGDSAFIPDDCPKEMNRIRARMWSYGKRNGQAYAIRQRTEDGTKGFRIWRTK